MPDEDPFEDVPDDPLDDLDRAAQVLTVRTDERTYGKQVVVIEGFSGDTDVGELASELKSTLGTGGTVKEGRIELQGDHADRVQALLEERGYQVRG